MRSRSSAFVHLGFSFSSSNNDFTSRRKRNARRRDGLPPEILRTTHEIITTLRLLAYLEIQPSVIISRALRGNLNNSVFITRNTKYVYDVD